MPLYTYIYAYNLICEYVKVQWKSNKGKIYRTFFKINLRLKKYFEKIP